MSDHPSVVELLARVMADVQAVKKGDRNSQQGFNFRGVDAVVNAVGPALREHGVVPMPQGQEIRHETYTTKSNTVMTRCVVRIRFTFHGPAGDQVSCSAYGESSDAGDKSTPKAHSVAYRTALLQALCIPTDDPDPDHETHERAAPVEMADPSTKDDIAARAKALPDYARAELTEWKKEQGIDLRRALTAATAEAILDKLDEIEASLELEEAGA